MAPSVAEADTGYAIPMRYHHRRSPEADAAYSQSVETAETRVQRLRLLAETRDRHSSTRVLVLEY